MKVWVAKVDMGALEDETFLFNEKPSTRDVVEALFEAHAKYWEEDNIDDVARNPEEYEVYIRIHESIAARRSDSESRT